MCAGELTGKEEEEMLRLLDGRLLPVKEGEEKLRLLTGKLAAWKRGGSNVEGNIAGRKVAA